MKLITYIDIMPNDIQELIWKFVCKKRQKELHIELFAEISNDIPPPYVLVYDVSTIYIKKLHEVMDKLSSVNGYDLVITKCYNYILWYLIQYFTVSSQDTTIPNGKYTERGYELYKHFNKMNNIIHRIIFNIQDIEKKNYLSLLEIEKRLTILTFHELIGFNILIKNIIQ